MATVVPVVPAVFQRKITLVDASKTLVYVLDATYGENEWSYSGLTVTGGSIFAQQHGASALLYAMGFRFYSPNTSYHKLPSTIATGLSASKQQNWMPYCLASHGYGYDKRITSGPGNKASMDLQLLDWLQLHSFTDNRLPAGHRWQNIIISNLAFFQANPQLITGAINGVPTGKDTERFDLANITPDGTPTDWANLIEICAAHMLNAGLVAGKRTSFDPTDGDPFSTDVVMRLTRAVVARMRVGTNAIGTIPAKAGVPDCQISVLAYSKHSAPPTLTAPGVYVQVALSYNRSGLSFTDLITQWGAKVDFVALYEYFDVMQWDYAIPQQLAVNKANYTNNYDLYHTAGALGVYGEMTGNFLTNIAGLYTLMLKCRTGTASYSTVVSDMVADVFGGDAKVAELLTLWGGSSTFPNKYSIRKYFDIINAMAEGWYKDNFKQLSVINYLKVTLPAQTDSTFGTAFARFLQLVIGMTGKQIIGSYDISLRLDEGNVLLDSWKNLRFFLDSFTVSPPPQWWQDITTPQAAANTFAITGTGPSSSDWSSAYTDLQTLVVRSEDLNSEDLVVVDVTPLESGGGNADNSIWVEHGGTFIFVGPGTLVYTPETGQEVRRGYYPAGINKVSIFTGRGRVRAEGGLVFLSGFPNVSFWNFLVSTYGRHDLWMYVQSAVAGAVAISALESSIGFTWNGGSVTILRGGLSTASNVIPTGQVRIRTGDGITRNYVEFGNVNPYLSPYPNKALMPRTIADTDFLTRLRVMVPAGAGSDDTNYDPLP